MTEPEIDRYFRMLDAILEAKDIPDEEKDWFEGIRYGMFYWGKHKEAIEETFRKYCGKIPSAP